MQNSSYWKKRFEYLEQIEHDEASSLLLQLEEHYLKAQREIERKIEVWYQRFAINNQISMSEARKWLSNKELAEFKWDVKEYIKYGEQNELNPIWMKELENASARYHISRLEALKIQTQHSLEVLFGNQTDALDQLMKNIYSDGYYHTIYEIQKGFNIGWDIASINQNKLEKIIKKPWAADGKNFSDRIWTNKSKLVNELHNELTQMAILGKAPDEAIRNISKKMKTSKNNAGRLVMTESAYFSSVAQKDAFNDLDVEQFEIVATLDSRTSTICQELDGKVFDMKDYEAGVTAPPFHVYCRTTTVPYFNDEFNVGERAARDPETGKTYYVPSNITYPQWKEKFVDKGDKSGLDEVDPSDIIKEPKVERKKLQLSDFPAAFTTKSEIKNTQKLIDYINDLEDADPNVVNLYGSMGKLENFDGNGIPFKISHGKNHAVQAKVTYGGDLVEVKLTIPKLSSDDLTGQINTTLHENMHLIDLYCRQDPKKYDGWFSTQSEGLKKAFESSRTGISDEVQELFKEYNAKHSEIHNSVKAAYDKKIDELRDIYKSDNSLQAWKTYEKGRKKAWKDMLEEVDYKSRNAMGGGIGNLQDIYDALSEGKYRDNGTVKYGHGSKYYKSKESQIQETIANYAALSVTRPDLIKLLKSDKPELVKELDALIQSMLEKVGE